MDKAEEQRRGEERGGGKKGEGERERGRGGEEGRGGGGAVEEKLPQPSIRWRLGGQRRRGQWQGSEGSAGTEGGAHVEGRAGAGVDATIIHHSLEGGEQGRKRRKEREGRERRWKDVRGGGGRRMGEGDGRMRSEESGGGLR